MRIPLGTIRITLGTMSVMVVIFSLNGAASVNAQIPAPDNLYRSRVEASTFFGAMIAGKTIGRGVNATGGEHLLARLNHGGSLGVRLGVHGALLGLEANILTTSNRAVVKNEFGVAFPNHAEQPVICSGDALLYPFRRAIQEGRIRPYLTSGVGGVLLSADLDNVGDKEPHGRLIWNAGGGVKVSIGEGNGMYVDLRFTNHRLLSGGSLGEVNLRSVGIGIGARF